MAAGFEHSVANMYFSPQAMLVDALSDVALAPAPASLGFGGLVANLIPVTLGNIVGGGVLVGLVYWFIYLRKPAA